MNWHSDIPLALSYDDVMLVPRRSRISSRRDVDTSTQLTRQLRLAVPLVSANMDTVTESAMAIAMARVGGIGIIHRFLTVDAQAREVAKVKRAEAPVIDDPHRIADDAPIREAHAMIRERGVSGLVVVDRRDHLVGMLTSRDLGMVPDAEFVRDAMTPRERLVVGEAGTPRDVALAMMRQARVEKLPLVDSEGRLVGLVTMRDMVTHAQRRETTTDARGHLAVGAAIGVRGDYLDRARALVEAGADVLVLDIAHGHAEHAVAAVSKVREGIGNDAVGIIAGNVATPDGARDLVEAGADGVKVGVGPGSVCTTRIVAGVGVPQLSAVLACAAACADRDVPVIADGGIRYPGDVAKAIGAGAATVMIGGLLAGTPESPGDAVTRDGRRVKVFRGMASATAAEARRYVDEVEDDFTPTVPEGVETVVPLRDPAPEVVRWLVGGLRSGMSYSDAASIAEMHRNAEFVRITPAGLNESHPHALNG
ncbi:MAG: IMP dehydrogenase [Thermoleophilia bacterium]|nr:IMP dehydrogenase [Thermoleophilia bacterium]